MFRPHRTSILIALVLLAIEACIALFAHDRFVRPYVGDVLVIPLLYFAAKAFFDIWPMRLAIIVLLFACVVEASQYLGLIEHLGLSQSGLAKVILGNTFQWGDVVAYVIGTCLALLMDRTMVRTGAYHP
ncbi:MAG: DUF2809 domain-containing protein [Flavobacteriales bacterium]|nr:DUF2809 domain-containing protein [Flavobacteriales bacterium]